MTVALRSACWLGLNVFPRPRLLTFVYEIKNHNSDQNSIKGFFLSFSHLSFDFDYLAFGEKKKQRRNIVLVTHNRRAESLNGFSFVGVFRGISVDVRLLKINVSLINF